VAAVKAYTFTTFVGEQEAVVEFAYWRGRPGVHTMPNGDPGYPDDPDELEIISVVIDGAEAELTDEQAEQLEERAFEYAIDKEIGEQAAYWDAVAIRRKEDSEL
jgi:hypothetical protein